MFHCNGWTFTWAVTLQAGTHVCLRRTEAAPIFAAIAEHEVTHLCGAPIVMNLIANAPDDVRTAFGHRVQAMTGGAAPPAAVLQKMAAQGIHMIHLYGLTECYGPATVCAWQEAWDALSADEQARMQARQGVRYPTLEAVDVIDPATMAPVARDGEAIGEIVLRGNTLMKGYLKNAAATAEAFAGDWYHTGDLAVMHADGYCEVKDRAKDIIISGGENISSIEVEGALYSHPAVLEAAVVARPDPKWGEAPCAFVTLKRRRRGHRAGSDRPLPHAARRLQVPEDGDLHRAAQDLHGQDPKARAARTGAASAQLIRRSSNGLHQPDPGGDRRRPDLPGAALRSECRQAAPRLAPPCAMTACCAQRRPAIANTRGALTTRPAARRASALGGNRRETRSWHQHRARRARAPRTSSPIGTGSASCRRRG